MAKVSDMTVEIKADTREFDRQLRRVQSQLWWMRYGDAVTFVALATLLAFMFIAGVLLS